MLANSKIQASYLVQPGSVHAKLLTEVEPADVLQFNEVSSELLVPGDGDVVRVFQVGKILRFGDGKPPGGLH